MVRFILRRILQTIPVLWAVATMTFFMLRLAPGGPFDDERQVSPEVMKTLQSHYGLDKPLMVQYVDYLKNLLKGDLGPSFKYPGRTVNEIIRDAFPKSMELGFYSMLIALALGLVMGVIASLKPNSIMDYVPSSLAMVGICLPTFVLGPLLVLVFALKLRWFPYPGWDTPATKVLPSLTLGAYYAAYIARLTRAGMREILTQDYIRTARAKGASARTVILRHALRGGILPVVSFMGPAFAGLVAGSFVIETIFDIPGLGKHFVTSAFNRDYTMVLGLVLFFATLIVIFNTLVDVVQVWLNPKLKLE
ncbi:ABC transporter permease subunit [bacterium]|jgi:oligopeptide transport system permease protein|nr:ABC transporter permease subunit [bacterium]